MKKLVSLYIILSIILFGCAPGSTKQNSIKPQTKPQTVKNVLLNQASSVNSTGFIKLQDGEDFYLNKGTYQFVPREKLAEALTKVVEINPPDVQKPYRVKAVIHIKLTNSELLNLTYLKDADFILVRRLGQEKVKYYTLPQELRNNLEKELTTPTYSKVKIIVFKGVLYTSISLAKQMNPNELKEVGKLGSQSLYVKKESRFPVNILYYIIEKKEFNGTYMYGGYGIIG